MFKKMPQLLVLQTFRTLSIMFMSRIYGTVLFENQWEIEKLGNSAYVHRNFEYGRTGLNYFYYYIIYSIIIIELR